MLNLALWFGLHTIFAQVFEFRAAGMQIDVPVLSSIDIPALVLTVAALIAVFRFKVRTLTIIAAAAAAGVLIWLASRVLDLR